MKFIRLDEDHFAYLTLNELRADQIERFRAFFEEWWPSKTMIIMRADEFIARSGEYEVVRAEPLDLAEVANTMDRALFKRASVVADGSVGMRRGE